MIKPEGGLETVPGDSSLEICCRGPFNKMFACWERIWNGPDKDRRIYKPTEAERV